MSSSLLTCIGLDVIHVKNPSLKEDAPKCVCPSLLHTDILVAGKNLHIVNLRRGKIVKEVCIFLLNFFCLINYYKLFHADRKDLFGFARDTHEKSARRLLWHRAREYRD
jgi:hypothetical protein